MSISGLLKYLCLFCALVASGKAWADNTLRVEDFTISNYDVQEVPVLLDNTDAIAGIQFTLSLPEGIELVGQPRLTERAASSMQVYYEKSTGVCAVMSFQTNRCFSGNEGAVLILSLQAEPGALLRNSTGNLTLSEIVLSDGTGNGGELDDVNATVTMLAGEFAVTSQDAAYVVRPEVPATVAVGLENSAEVKAFQADIVVPEGFTVDVNSFKMTSRCVEGITCTVNLLTDGVTYRVLMFDAAGGGNVINLPEQGAESDVIFTFDVTAPATFADARAEIQIKEVEVSALGNQAFDGGTTAIVLENGKVPYDSAMAEVARLRQALADALATIAEEAADVKDNFTGEDITAQIDALEAALSQAYTDGTPATGYAALLEPVPAIDEAIAKLVADAKAAQEAEAARRAANEEAYNADLETIAGLQTELDNAVADIAENYPGYDAAEDQKAIQDAIDDAKAAADKAYADVAEEGTYSNTVDADSIRDLIEKMMEAAEMTGIDTIMVEVEAGNAAIYNLQGVRLNTPARGQMNIVVDKAGKAFKIFVR